MRKKILFSILSAFVLLSILAPGAHSEEGKLYLLRATSKTVHTGFFDNSLPPVLTIDSGDIVVLETMMLMDDQLRPGLTMDELLRIRKAYVDAKVGAHTLTGPIYVNGAEPDDVLEVRIKRLIPRPYAVNYNLPGDFRAGALPEDFPTGQVKDFYLDWTTKTATFTPGIVILLRPFLGVIGVAPKVPGRHHTTPPDEFGGNMDLKELVEGTTLYLPVFVKGALFSTGDAHAAQGDGEVNVTALETAMSEATLQFIVRKDLKLKRPMAETPTHWITMAFHKDLDEAVKIALRDMIDFLVKNKGFTPLDAYALASVAVDLRITQVVDINKGVHAMLPKEIFTKK